MKILVEESPVPLTMELHDRLHLPNIAQLIYHVCHCGIDLKM